MSTDLAPVEEEKPVPEGFKIFTSEEFGQVRVVAGPDGEPWFMATDVAIVLGYRDAANMTRNLDDEDKGTHILSTLGGDQNVTIINESGLYAAVFHSRKPEAKMFKKYVTSEILPSVRRHGIYATDDAIEKALADPDSWIRVMEQLKKERAEKNRIAQDEERGDFHYLKKEPCPATGAQSLLSFICPWFPPPISTRLSGNRPARPMLSISERHYHRLLVSSCNASSLFF